MEDDSCRHSLVRDHRWGWQEESTANMQHMSGGRAHKAIMSTAEVLNYKIQQNKGSEQNKAHHRDI